MLGITLSLIINAALLFLISRFLISLRAEGYRKLQWLEYELKKKKEMLASSTRENEYLRVESDAVIGLYDITKDICRTLGEENMLVVFKEYAYKFLGAGDYGLVKTEQELKNFPKYASFKLEVNKDTVGYLIADNFNQQNADKFQILGEQLLIGIKRNYLYQKVQELAITDNLTQAYTRRYFLERFEEELERSAKFKHTFSFLMLDIDHFKEYNDRYGHLVGDAVLREIARILKENIRQVDFVGRYGGEELSIVLAETGKAPARIVAERIRSSINSNPLNIYDESLSVTVSIGVSAFPDDGLKAKELIEKADKALYKAKEGGRNKVCLFGSLD